MVADWAAVATALATWLLFIAGGAGVYVVWRQLRTLNDSEKLKNTLEILRRYDREAVPFRHDGKEQAVTPAVAYARVASPLTLEFFRKYDLSQGLNADYRERWASVVVAINYFKSVGSLWERGALDNALFFNYLAPQVVKTFEVFRELHTLRGQTTPRYGLGNFAAAAEAFIKARESMLERTPSDE